MCKGWNLLCLQEKWIVTLINMIWIYANHPYVLTETPQHRTFYESKPTLLIHQSDSIIPEPETPMNPKSDTQSTQTILKTARRYIGTESIKHKALFSLFFACMCHFHETVGWFTNQTKDATNNFNMYMTLAFYTKCTWRLHFIPNWNAWLTTQAAMWNI